MGAAALALFATACGSNAPSNSSASSEANPGAAASSSANASTESSTASTASATGASKILVAYFSATGSTRRVAERAAETLGADTFEIVPEDPYSSDDLNYNNDQSRVTREHDDSSLQDVPLAKTTPDNWADYDVVLLGYPIWWGLEAWPTNRFTSDNDFSGKAVIPFCTSSSLGIGDSSTSLQKLASTGEWLEGIRFPSSVGDNEVTNWANGLGL
jgi:hypothetical protein